MRASSTRQPSTKEAVLSGAILALAAAGHVARRVTAAEYGLLALEVVVVAVIVACAVAMMKLHRGVPR